MNPAPNVTISSTLSKLLVVEGGGGVGAPLNLRLLFCKFILNSVSRLLRLFASYSENKELQRKQKIKELCLVPEMILK